MFRQTQKAGFSSKLAAAALAAFLSGCAVGPRYGGPPAAELHGFHNSAAIESRQVATVAPPGRNLVDGIQ